jgi:hypothetical protein
VTLVCVPVLLCKLDQSRPLHACVTHLPPRLEPLRNASPQISAYRSPFSSPNTPSLCTRSCCRPQLHANVCLHVFFCLASLYSSCLRSAPTVRPPGSSFRASSPPTVRACVYVCLYVCVRARVRLGVVAEACAGWRVEWRCHCATASPRP